MNRCILVALVAVGVFVSVSLADTVKPRKIDKKLVKNFAKINEYLEKNVYSDDLEDNVEKATQWMKEKSKLSLLLDRSFEQALQVFIWLPDTIANATTCNREWSRRVLEKCDEGLSDEVHLKSKDYPLTRIDRVLESVAYKHVRLCRLSKKIRPELIYDFKQLAYDHINGDLVDKVPDSDPEINMKAAEQMLLSSNKMDGSYARALKQLLALKSVTTKESCNERGIEIILKNELAAGIHAYTSASDHARRIGKLVYHYTLEHATVCHPVYLENCLAKLGQLDDQTYRKVLGLASADHLRTELYDDLVAEVKGKQVGEDFTTSVVAEMDKSDKISEPAGYPEKIFRFFKATTKQDPRAGSMVVVDEKSGKRVVVEDKVRELYNEYFVVPCKKFNSIMESDLDVFEHNWRAIGFSNRISESDGKPFNFRLLHSAFQSCKDRINYLDNNVLEIVERLQKFD